MTSPRWDDDDRLLTDLKGAMRDLPPAPPDFVHAAMAAFSWRTVDAELALAELVFDSATDAQLLTRTRSGGSARTLAFQADDVSVEIELTEAGIAGQLSPASGGRITAEGPNGVFDQTTVDEIGCFLLSSPPAGPVRLRAQTEGYTVVTGWVCAD